MHDIDSNLLMTRLLQVVKGCFASLFSKDVVGNLHLESVYLQLDKISKFVGIGLFTSCSKMNNLEHVCGILCGVHASETRFYTT